MFRFSCPRCTTRLTRHRESGCMYWGCVSCKGRMLSVGPLRKMVPKEAFRDLWQRVRESQETGDRACASCRLPLQVVTVDAHETEVELDVCRSCQLVWFDPGEMDSMAVKAEEPELSPEVSNQLKQAMLPYEMDKIGGRYAHEQAIEKDWKQEKWGALHSAWLDRAYDLPVEHRRSGLAGFPLMSWALTLLMTAGVILPMLDPALWGEIWAYDSTRPAGVGGITLITSCIFDVTPYLFLIQLYFMIVYAGRVESALGPWRLLLLFVVSHVGGLLAFSAIDLSRAFVWSGAEAAVTGVLFAFATLYPQTSFGPNWRTSGSFVEEYGTMEPKGYISIWVLVVMWVAMQPFPYFMGGESADFIVTWAGGVVGMALAWFWRQ